MKNLLKKKKPPHTVTPRLSHVEIDAVIPPTAVNVTPESAGGTFAKIDVPATVVNPKPKKKIWLWVTLAGLVVIIVAIVVFGILPVQTAYSQMKQLIVSGKELAAALKSQNLEEAKSKIPDVRAKLTSTKDAWLKIYLLRLPFLNKYYNDGTHGLNAAGYGLDALEIAVTTIEPYADLLGLKGKGTFTGGSADQRIQLAVQTLDKMTPRIADIGDKVARLQSEVDQIDPNRYPEKVGATIIRSRLVSGKQLLGETTQLFLNAKPLLEVLPQLLGQPTAKRYIVLFQNDKELRPTGGFLTAYANFRVDKGKFIVEKSNDIYELDDTIKTKTQAPPDILTYHKGVYYFYIRDSNLSPDFAASMKQFIGLYPTKPFDFDGLITVDTHVLVEAIKILGEFDIAGRKFSADTDPRCGCPRVIYELEDYSTRPVAYVRTARKDILGELLLQIMKKALGVSPSKYWGRLMQMALSEINQKHILAYMVDAKAQAGIESFNMAGRIADGVQILGYKDGQDWDYLHINDANMAGAKSNLFINEQVKDEYSVENDGAISKTLTVTYKNPSPPSDCNLERGGLCLNGLLRNWVRVYVPKGSVLVSSKGGQSPQDGSAEDFKTIEDLGKTAFEGFLTVRPQGSAEFVLKYKLPFKKNGSMLTTLYQKQPGTDGNEYTVLVNGKQKEKFNLIADQAVKLAL